MEIKDLLREEVENESNYLSEIEYGTAEYKAVVDGIIKLTDRVIEIEKLETNLDEKAKDREAAKEKENFERELKEKQLNEMILERELKQKQAKEAEAQAEFERKLKIKQMEEDRKDRLIKNGIAIAGILLPIGLSVWGTFKSFEFEKEGTITTIMGRGYINKLIPKK